MADGSVAGTVVQISRPAAIGANQNNFAVQGNPGIIFISASVGGVNITGLAGLGVDGQQITFIIIGANAITFQNQNAGSSAANRIKMGQGVDVLISVGSSVTFTYDATQQRWIPTAGDNTQWPM